MKIKNIVFSGVMGAILATAANAAPTIASKAYVDGLVGENVTNLTQIIEDDFDVLSGAIEDNATAIAGVDAAYQAADATTLSSAKGYTDQEITKLNNSLSTTGGSVEALALRVKANEDNIATHTTDIATNTQGVAENKAAIDAINNADTGLLSQAKAYTDALAENAVATNTQGVADNKAAIDAINNAATGLLSQAKAYTDALAENAVATNTQNIATNTAAIETLNGDGEGSIAKSIADAISTYATKKYVDDQDSALDGKITTNANAIGAVDTLTTSEKTNTVGAINEVNANVTTLMANAETTGSVDNKVATSAAQTKTAYETYAIPKPSDSDCNAASGLCVLSVSADGQTLTWVDVTDTVTAGDTGESSGTTGE